MNEHVDIRDADVVTYPDGVKPNPQGHGSTPLRVNYKKDKAQKPTTLAQRVIKLGGPAAEEEVKVNYELAGEKGPGMPKLDNSTVQGEKEW
jgi:hypothetical protein